MIWLIIIAAIIFIWIGAKGGIGGMVKKNVEKNHSDSILNKKLF